MYEDPSISIVHHDLQMIFIIKKNVHTLFQVVNEVCTTIALHAVMCHICSIIVSMVVACNVILLVQYLHCVHIYIY